VASGNGRCRRLQVLECGRRGSAPASVGATRSLHALQGRPPVHVAPTPSGAGGSAAGAGASRFAGRLKSPFGDVGVRFGGSELHQGRAPALRLHRPPRWWVDAIRATPVVWVSSEPLGVRAAASGRRAVWTPTALFGGEWVCCQRPRPMVASRRRRTCSCAGALRQPRLRPRRAQARASGFGHAVRATLGISRAVQARRACSKGRRATAAVMRCGC